MEEKLKGNNCKEIAKIPAKLLQRANQNSFRRFKDCLCAKGQRFHHFL
jgi:hypothetical protein